MEGCERKASSDRWSGNEFEQAQREVDRHERVSWITIEKYSKGGAFGS